MLQLAANALSRVPGEALEREVVSTMKPPKGGIHEKFLTAGCCWPQCTAEAGLRNPVLEKLGTENPYTLQEPAQSSTSQLGKKTPSSSSVSPVPSADKG